MPVSAERLLRNCFANYDHITDGSPCWDWLGKISQRGYGQLTVRVKGKSNPVNVYAHRESVLVFQGIEPGEVVMHKCDRPCCINPAHLQNGTHKSNYDDAMSKGRHVNYVPPTDVDEDWDTNRF